MKQTTLPVIPIINCLKTGPFSVLNWTSIAVSNDKIETSAETKVMTFDAEIIGLFEFLYLTTLIMALMTE